ncbi:MAG: anti-sigma factor [Anaerolineae bacterium]|nr:anti-sigma factor [Anaerolineae bacterium]MDW8100069.1 anti-sigma factor [Anaerolineae bacterium]
MSHEVVRDLIPAYALGAADVEEQAEVERHLKQCAACRALLADYRLLADDLLYAVPQSSAPSHLAADLRRLLAQSQPREGIRRRPTLWTPRLKGFSARAGIWIALAVSVVLLFATNLYWWGRTTAIEEQVAVQATAIVALAEAPTVILQGDAPAPNARGVLYYRPEAAVAILHVYHLPPLEQGKAYQVWLIRNGQRDSGGLFTVNEEGEGTVLITAPRPLREYAALGVTIEPAGGSPGPTSPRVLGGGL